MLKGEYQHDGAGELTYIGDITSVPASLRVLKDNPPTVYADGRKSYICTYAQASAALVKITGYTRESYGRVGGVVGAVSEVSPEVMYFSVSHSR